MICLNGAAARMVQVADHIILMSYCDLTPEEAKNHQPRVVFVDDNNQIRKVSRYEKHGQLFDEEK
jgi:aspartate 1-decarboxylase